MNAAILILSAVLCGYIVASIVWLWYVLRENWRLTMRMAALEGRLSLLETLLNYHGRVISELRRRTSP
jgi:hypothetical protein